jgi:hypothetical protein
VKASLAQQFRAPSDVGCDRRSIWALLVLPGVKGLPGNHRVPTSADAVTLKA